MFHICDISLSMCVIPHVPYMFYLMFHICDISCSICVISYSICVISHVTCDFICHMCDISYSIYIISFSLICDISYSVCVINIFLHMSDGFNEDGNICFHLEASKIISELSLNPHLIWTFVEVSL